MNFHGLVVRMKATSQIETGPGIVIVAHYEDNRAIFEQAEEVHQPKHARISPK